MSLSIPTMAAIRFGYGLCPGEVAAENSEQLLAQIDAGIAAVTPYPREGQAARRESLVQRSAEQKTMRQSGVSDVARREARQIARRHDRRMLEGDVDARIAQAVTSPNPFYERLVVFWSDHFSVSARKSDAMLMLAPLYEAEVIRPHVGGSFGELLHKATQHPAMLIYLDQVNSVGPGSPAGLKRGKGLNENLGRELLELHTIGAGSGYSQTDVHSAALVLTGLSLDRDAMEPTFLLRSAEPGRERVLGIDYGGGKRHKTDYLIMLDDLAANPKTARYICRKLAVHFIADAPDVDMVADMEAAWRNSEGQLSVVYAAMLAHPAAWRDAGAKARQPFDYIVAGLRAFGTDGTAWLTDMMLSSAIAEQEPEASQAMMASPNPMAGGAPMMAEPMAAPKQTKAARVVRMLGRSALIRMGQPVWEPPSPAGFDEGFGTWITASQIAERLAWARKAAAQLGAEQDPREFLRQALADAARDDTIRVVSQAPNRLSGLTLALASPEFNRR
ncbi:MAG: DUF1800 domain-containing protein [Allorhizobium sp.]